VIDPGTVAKLDAPRLAALLEKRGIQVRLYDAYGSAEMLLVEGYRISCYERACPSLRGPYASGIAFWTAASPGLVLIGTWNNETHWCAQPERVDDLAAELMFSGVWPSGACPYSIPEHVRREYDLRPCMRVTVWPATRARREVTARGEWSPALMRITARFSRDASIERLRACCDEARAGVHPDVLELQWHDSWAVTRLPPRDEPERCVAFLIGTLDPPAPGAHEAGEALRRVVASLDGVAFSDGERVQLQPM
jgi:hypothetical protein